MALPTFLILGLLVSTIPIITCQDSNAAEISDVSDKNANVVIPGENGTVIDPVKEMTNRRNTFTCPAASGRFPHPGNCEYYFECRNGYPTLWHCNRGYLYDRERKQCRDWRYVKCYIKDTVNDVKEDPRYFKCPDIWGLFPHPYDCSKYYVCDNYHPKLYQCYPNFLFDVYQRHCLPSHKVNCGSRLNRDQLRTTGRPQVTQATTVQPGEIRTIAPKTNNFYCPFPYGYFPDPEDCSRYYECRYTVPHLHKCPGTTLYDERKEQCLDKSIVKCNGRPGGNNENGIEIKINVQCPYFFGIFVHPVDCSKYIICIYNSPSVLNCRKNELFDAYYRRCLPADNVACNERINPDNPYQPGKTTAPPVITTTTPTPPTTTTPEPTTTKATTIDTFSTTQPVTKPNTPPPTDCKEDDLDCIIDETGDVSGWFDCPKRFGHYPHGSSRQLFIHCDNWRPFVKRCAENTHFSPVYLVCVWENKRQGVS